MITEMVINVFTVSDTNSFSESFPLKALPTLKHQPLSLHVTLGAV